MIFPLMPDTTLSMSNVKREFLVCQTSSFGFRQGSIATSVCDSSLRHFHFRMEARAQRIQG